MLLIHTSRRSFGAYQLAPVSFACVRSGKKKAARYLVKMPWNTPLFGISSATPKGIDPRPLRGILRKLMPRLGSTIRCFNSMKLKLDAFRKGTHIFSQQFANCRLNHKCRSTSATCLYKKKSVDLLNHKVTRYWVTGTVNPDRFVCLFFVWS